MNIVTTILKNSIYYIRCGFIGHYVSKEDEEKLFHNKEEYLETICSRCNYPILLKKDIIDNDEKYYILMEN